MADDAISRPWDLRTIVDTAESLSGVTLAAGQRAYDNTNGVSYTGPGTVGSMLPDGVIPAPDLRSLTSMDQRWSYCAPWLGSTTGTLTSLREMWFLSQWPYAVPMADLAVDITAGVGGSNVVIAAYACNPNGSIGARLARASVSTATAVIASVSVAGLVKPGAWFWACVCSDAAITARMPSGAVQTISTLGFGATSVIFYLYKAVAQLSDAAPVNAPALTNALTISGSAPPTPFGRRA